MASALDPVACEIPKYVAVPPPHLPHGACGSGPQHCWGGGLGVLTCPAMPQACDVAPCLSSLPGKAQSSDISPFSVEVTGLGPGCVEEFLLL